MTQLDQLVGYITDCERHNINPFMMLVPSLQTESTDEMGHKQLLKYCEKHDIALEWLPKKTHDFLWGCFLWRMDIGRQRIRRVPVFHYLPLPAEVMLIQINS